MGEESNTPTGEGPSAVKPKSELHLRVISAVILALAALGSAWWGGVFFWIVWGIAATFVFEEWFGIASGEPEIGFKGVYDSKGTLGRRPIYWAFIFGGVAIFLLGGFHGKPLPQYLFSSLMAASFFAGISLLLIVRATCDWNQRLWLSGGLIYAGGLLASVLLLRNGAEHGFAAILFLFFVVWGADVGAYFAGRSFGGPKLAPAISPNKTWSGLIGGLITASLAGCTVLVVMGIALRPMHIVLAAILALVSAMGDLFESFFKRKFGVKDSSNLIPGHGGFMDRLDAFIFAAILAAIIGVARGSVEDAGGGLLANW